MKYFYHKNEGGFTLVELMTALSIFMIVMTVAMGAVLSIFNANRKTQSESSVMNNLNLAVESMAREIRFGSNYYCGVGGSAGATNNCDDGEDTISFISSKGEPMVYTLSANSLQRSENNGPYVAVTAPEIVIQQLKFYVFGAGSTNTLQPKVVITVKGYSDERITSRTDFSLQTLVSQRKLDNGQ